MVTAAQSALSGQHLPLTATYGVLIPYPGLCPPSAPMSLPLGQPLLAVVLLLLGYQRDWELACGDSAKAKLSRGSGGLRKQCGEKFVQGREALAFSRASIKALSVPFSLLSVEGWVTLGTRALQFSSIPYCCGSA